MKEELIKLIDSFKEDRRLYSFDEASTKQAVILRVLKVLGWDPFNVDEVYPEYSVGSKRVDYALRYNDKNKVFIEVKKVSENLEKYQEQLLSYSFQEGVKLAILTNGISWWFYLPLREGNWEQRKFYTIEVYDQPSSDIAKRFEEFLSRENVINDKAVENAESIYKNKQKQYIVRKTLPQAWEKIIAEPDEFLVELLVETTERMCGYKPNYEMVKQFLTNKSKELFKDTKEDMLTSVHTSQTLTKDVQSYAKKSIVAFIFQNKEYSVRSWKEMLLKIVNIMIDNHREKFNKVLELRGKKRPYFSKNPRELRKAERISNTDIYVETNLSANQIVKLSIDIIKTFGYKEEDLIIKTA